MLLHRSLALDSSFHTRKVLVDVLSAQNLVDKAAKEYEIMLNSDDMDRTERSMVLEQYQGVLKVKVWRSSLRNFGKIAGQVA